MKKIFNLGNTINAIKAYGDRCFFDPKDVEYKPFYRLEELSGWKFYRKATKNHDWASIRGHILSVLGLR